MFEYSSAKTNRKTYGLTLFLERQFDRQEKFHSTSASVAKRAYNRGETSEFRHEVTPARKTWGAQEALELFN